MIVDTITVTETVMVIEIVTGTEISDDERDSSGDTRQNGNLADSNVDKGRGK